MILVWHDARILDPVQFPDYEKLLCERAENGETVLGLVRLSRCALVGAFEDPQRALRLSYIGDRFPIVRRLTGGGSLSLDRDTLLLVLAVPRSRAPSESLAGLMAAFCESCVRAVKQHGMDAEFTAPNDIVTGGRKIGSGFLLRTETVVLFEAAITLALDVEELLKTLRLPLEKLSEKGLLTARKRFAPLRTLAPDLVSATLHSTLAQALGGRLGATSVREKPPTPHARNLPISISEPPADVSAFLKTLGGVLYLDVWLDQGPIIRKARFAGGIPCADPLLFTRLATALVGTGVAALESSLKDVLSPYPVDILGVDAADIAYLGHLCAARYRIGARLSLADAAQITLFSPDRAADADTLLTAVQAVLLPYCAKPSWCKWRHRDGCPECGQCAVGEAYRMARERDLEVITITAYEHLCSVLADLKGRGVRAFLGVCCTDFFLKRDYAFIEAGMGAVFIDIGGDTCYTLRAEEAAYAGRFEAEAFLDPRLFAKVLSWRDQLTGAPQLVPGKGVGVTKISHSRKRATQSPTKAATLESESSDAP
ncbi:MAG: lipoate--protein ligase family protein [Acidiferrobacter sp.]